MRMSNLLYLVTTDDTVEACMVDDEIILPLSTVKEGGCSAQCTRLQCTDAGWSVRSGQVRADRWQPPPNRRKIVCLCSDDYFVIK